MTDSILGGLGISRDDLLGGMPARRASTILYAIENMTHQLVSRSRRALARYQPADSAQDRERRFMDAVGAGREERPRPHVQDLERYATEWAYLVPDVADTQAQLLFQMSTRYALVYGRTPRLRTALAVDTPAVAAAYQKQQTRDISTAFVDDSGWRERLRWWRASVSERLETMPPFWMAFSLTLTETVGGGMLAIPIALAWVGVPAGLVLLGVFGLISIVTVAALVEAIVRDGKMRYGNGYFGQLVENRLGRPGGIAMGAALFALNAISLLVAMTGFGLALADQTGFSALIWVALLFAAILFVLRRENLDATIAAALLIGLVILTLAVVMIVVGLTHVRPELLDGPKSASGSLALIALVFGVLLFVFFGHTSAGNAARSVLRRDPSGRSLLWGNVAAMAVAAVLYGLFVIAVNGSVPANVLASQAGTAVKPLANIAGPVVGVLGAIYVVLSLGIGSLYVSLGLYNQATEQIAWRLPSAKKPLRFAIAAAPVAIIFVVMEALLWLGVSSFAGMVNLVGALTVPLLGGVFPMLIVAAARRRGERVPGTPLRWLASWPVVAFVVALYLGAVLAHAVFIWSGPLERLVAGATAVGMAVLIVASFRRRSFAPRAVVELRADEPPGGGALVSVVSAGQDFSTERIAALASSSEIGVDLPSQRPAELYVWAHRPTRDGDDEPLSVQTSGPAPDHLILVTKPGPA